MDIKSETRKAALARRDTISPDERARRSAEICDQVITHLLGTFNADDSDAWFGGKTIAVYQAMRSEVSLDKLIRAAYEKGAKVCFPSMEKKSANKRATADLSESEMRANVHLQGTSSRETPASNLDKPCEPSARSTMIFRTVSQRHYEANDMEFTVNPLKSMDASDPLFEAHPEVGPRDIDAVIVPMVAFDKSFNRLGYGGGNYDCFLAQVKQSTIIVGVAFEEQRVDHVPLEDHDLPLPLIISG